MDLLPQNGQRLAHKLQLVQLQRVKLAHLQRPPRLSRSLRAQAAPVCLSSHLFHGPHGVLYQGPLCVIYVERHAERRKGREDVTAQMRQAQRCYTQHCTPGRSSGATFQHRPASSLTPE